MLLALGLHDQESNYKASAGAVMKAAQALAAAKDFAVGQEGRRRAEGRGPGPREADAELKWEKVAALPELMKQVPIINNPLKRAVKPAKFKKKAKETAGYTAVIAAIAQGSMADFSETKNPEEVKQWYDLRRPCAMTRPQ